MPDQPMRFGILTPIVSLNPRRKPTWEIEAGPSELRQIAQAADRLGYHHMTCSEHVGIPTAIAKVRGGRYYDPLATFGFMAAITTRVRFATHVLVLPYHHPLAVAKRYGTLDTMSGGRLILGLGVGTLRQEFELLDAEFEGRAALYTDGLKALRAALGQRQPAYHGTHYHFDDFLIDPPAVQQHVPIWLGGSTALSLRRALDAADGWDPVHMPAEKAGEIIARSRAWPEAQSFSGRTQRRTAPFEIVLQPEPPFDPAQAGQRATLVDYLALYQKAGATMLNLSFQSHSLSHYLEQLETFMAKIAPQFG